MLFLKDEFLVLPIDQDQKGVATFCNGLLNERPQFGVHTGPVRTVFELDQGNGKPALVEHLGLQSRGILVADVPRRNGVEFVEGGAPVQAFDGRRGLAVVRLAVRHIRQVLRVFVVRLQADDFCELRECFLEIFGFQSGQTRLVQFVHVGVLDLLVSLPSAFHEQQPNAQFRHACIVRFCGLKSCNSPGPVVGHARFIKLGQVVVQHPLPGALQACQCFRIGRFFLDSGVVKACRLRHHAHLFHLEPALGVGLGA